MGLLFEWYASWYELRHCSVEASWSNQLCWILLSQVSGLDIKTETDTDTALVVLMNDLWLEWDAAGASIFALLDISVAFSTINHGIFWGQLKELGLGDIILCWFTSFLSLKPAPISVDSWQSLLCGVPQGLVLSHLFLKSTWNGWSIITKEEVASLIL